MLISQCCSDNLHCLLVERLGLGIPARGLKHTSEVAEADGIGWMLRAEGGPPNLQGVSAERLCLVILARGL